MEEVWKVAKDHPNYEVSTFGRVRNIRTGKFLNPFTLKPTSSDKVINLCEEGVTYKISLKKFLAQNFDIAQAPADDPKKNICIGFINGDVDDYRIENLIWCRNTNEYVIRKYTHQLKEPEERKYRGGRPPKATTTKKVVVVE